MNLGLENKVALITGGSRGIGKGIVEKFAEAGCSIAFTFLSSVEKAKVFEDEISQKFRIKIKGFQSNAALFADSEKLVDDVVKEFGNIDILINNAGITRDNLLMRMTEDQWDEVITTNLKSVFNLSKSAVKYMMKARKGSIINISSIVGLQGNAGQTNYSASKAGVFGFTKSLSKEIGSRNVRVNSISPGFIETEMTGELPENVIEQWKQAIPLKRPGSVADVAGACLFLASDLSGYITGQNITVDGGLHM